MLIILFIIILGVYSVIMRITIYLHNVIQTQNHLFIIVKNEELWK